MDMNVVSDILDDAELTREPEEFKRKLAAAINEHGWNNRCSVPDYILAKMLHRTLLAISMMDRETRRHNTPEPEITEPTLEDRVKDYASSSQEPDPGEGWELCERADAEQFSFDGKDWIRVHDGEEVDHASFYRRRKVMPGKPLAVSLVGEWLLMEDGTTRLYDPFDSTLKPSEIVAWCHRLDGETEPPKILVDWEGE